VITMEEQRLSEVLKRAVPEPPVELSADRVTAEYARYAGRSRRSRLTPALAAAAIVVAAASGIGLAAIHHSSTFASVARETTARQATERQTTARETTRTIRVTLTDASAKASTTAPKTFVMPDVVGMSSAQAVAALNAAGAAGNVEMTFQGLTGQFNASAPQGTVYQQYPAPGTTVRYVRLASPVPRAKAGVMLVPSQTPTPASFQPGWMQTPQVTLYVQPSSS
jgi:hypothetical protein